MKRKKNLRLFNAICIAMVIFGSVSIASASTTVNVIGEPLCFIPTTENNKCYIYSGSYSNLSEGDDDNHIIMCNKRRLWYGAYQFDLEMYYPVEPIAYPTHSRVYLRGEFQILSLRRVAFRVQFTDGSFSSWNHRMGNTHAQFDMYWNTGKTVKRIYIKFGADQPKEDNLYLVLDKLVVEYN